MCVHAASSKDKPLKLVWVSLDGDEIKSAAPGNDINLQFKEEKKKKHEPNKTTKTTQTKKNNKQLCLMLRNGFGTQAGAGSCCISSDAGQSS